MAKATEVGRRIAWVTGASSGFGKALALRLCSEGWIVAASARRASELDALADEAQDSPGRIHPVPLDVTDLAVTKQAFDGIIDRLGPIDLAVLNSGFFKPDVIDPFDATLFAQHFAVNTVGIANCLEPLLAHLISRQQGHIVLLGSVSGYGGFAFSTAYGASKAAVINLAESLYLRMKPHGVKVQVVNPASVRTPMTDREDRSLPILVELDEAIDLMMDGIQSDRFEIAFPKKLTNKLKLLRCLPYSMWFKAIGRQKG